MSVKKIQKQIKKLKQQLERVAEGSESFWDIKAELEHAQSKLR